MNERVTADAPTTCQWTGEAMTWDGANWVHDPAGVYCEPHDTIVNGIHNTRLTGGPRDGLVINLGFNLKGDHYLGPIEKVHHEDGSVTGRFHVYDGQTGEYKGQTP